MQAEEKVVWMKVFIFISLFWKIPLVVMGVLTAPSAIEGSSVFLLVWFIIWLILVAVYLLILSWRVAYISGSKKGRK